MPKEAKPRKEPQNSHDDPRRASRTREPRAAKEAARDASHASHASRGAGESGGRGFRRWTSFVICLLGIQALAVLSLWRSGDRLPSETNRAPKGSPNEPAPEAARSNGQVFLGTAPPAAPPAQKKAPLGPEFTGPAAEEGDIAVLLIASGRSVSSLQQTLRPKESTNVKLRVKVNSPKLLEDTYKSTRFSLSEASREAAAELGVAWVGPSPMADFATFDGEAEPWLHYGRSLEHAATKHFAGQSFRSLFVAEEDLIFSSGLFSFLAQLHPLLFEDDSLWCISAWNDYSLAPFASDVSSVLRSSWFSGRAWMVTLRRIREELLPNWSLQQRWRPLLRQWAMAASKECLLPEVSRVAFTNYQCEGVGIRGQCDEEEVDARHRAVSAIFAPRKLGQLGEVGRLKKEKFVTLLGSSWPRNGGLRSAVAVTSVHQLYEDTATPLLLLIEDQELSPSAGGSVRVTGEVKEVQNGQRLILHDRGSTLQVDASSLIRPVNGVLPGVHVQAVGELEGPQLKARILRVLHNMDMALYEECLLLRRRVEAQYIDIPAPS
ncbi:unnamed protein product [Cladocopium goreaui]|uniref:alpha-1,3-mannosyl-glycoprotein 2-beta-N-acetylglucosaminyltransferase n=1 Tax=Cladocopium goreaui TaxID=2562237 RepID=A0A9P1GEU2_9DINO|nr:unnamed protein product [Cladocopium goreaui]